MKRFALLLLLASCDTPQPPHATCEDMAIACDLEQYCLWLCDMGSWRLVECRACGEPGMAAWSGRNGACYVPRHECSTPARE